MYVECSKMLTVVYFYAQAKSIEQSTTVTVGIITNKKCKNSNKVAVHYEGTLVIISADGM